MLVVVVVVGAVVVVVVGVRVVVVVVGGELDVVVGAGGCWTGGLDVVEVLEDVLEDVVVSDDDVVPEEDVVVSDDDVDGPTIAGTWGTPAEGGTCAGGGSVALGSRFSTLTDKRFIWSSSSCLRAPLSTVCTVELTATSLSCAADH